MALNANALIDLNPFKLFIGIPTTELSRDTELETFINEASTLIETYCNRFFRERTITEKISGDRNNELLLNQWPVNSITSIHVSENRVFDATTLLAAINYDIEEDEKGEGVGVVRFDGCFSKGIKNIQAIYVMGYNAIANVPPDLQLACKITAAYYFQISENRDFTVAMKTKGDEDVTLIQGIPKNASLILNDYKRLEMY